ncbi:MAG: helix-turn-helix domain-containing protein [Solirubrobacteraceae bacterium]
MLDLLGRRWTLRILWELRDGSAPTFRELKMRCGELSSSVLNQRLGELREAGIVIGRHPNGYHLTDDGRDLLGALAPLDLWARDWGKRAGGGGLGAKDEANAP